MRNGILISIACEPGRLSIVFEVLHDVHCFDARAIGGPLVELDIRDLYLKDLTLKGSTYQGAGVFENLIGYIERGEIQPVIAGTYPLSEIVQAQTDFLAKGFIGKLVLVPPGD